MGNKDCLPFSPCFCEKHPELKKCNTQPLPIDNGLYILTIIAIIFAFIGLYQKKLY